jgi:hypothetical protein
MRVRGLMLSALLAPASTALAVDTEHLSRLPDLVRADRMEAAYALASEHVDARAGDPEFDLYYGIAAIETGHVDDGIFALERVLFQRPELDRARVELARAYFLQEEDRKAREQFEIVLAHDPPPAVVDRIERYLAAIQRRADRYEPTVTGRVELAGGIDDNVNRVSEDTTTVELVPGFNLEVGANNDTISDAFARADAGVNASFPVAPGLNVIASGGAHIKGHEDRTEFDRKGVNARAGLRYRTGSHRWTATLGGQRVYIGSDPFVRTFGVNGSYRHTLDDTMGVHASADVTQLRYDEQEQRDATRWLLGGGLSKRWQRAWNPRGRFTVLLGQESAEEDSQAARSQAERDIGRLRGRLSLAPLPDWTLRTDLDVTVSRYDSAGPIVPPEAREEETYTLDLALDWRPTVNWTLGPFVSYTQRESNVAIFEYDRTAGGVRVRYSFY